ncbi:hypothetical protein ACPYPG_01860 [Streptomyces sp. FR-108]|uniref:hypothetical protein n=1 Tax=Streptomyces sp. FR-108 TaxID=3416665 RepID=UPI003CFB0D8C
MTENDSDREAHRRCKACGSRPAGNEAVCEHCRAVLELPDPSGLVEDEGAAIRRDFDRRDGRPENVGTRADDR